MKIFIYDEFSPEDTAMMQALYSRSAASVVEHAAKVKQSGSGKFMEKFYVGYGHASIADCGSTTLFIEDVSVLADKALQDWPLYSGQETSTRYVDMSTRRLEDPVGTSASQAIQRRWMEFYLTSMPAVEAHVKKCYPRRPEEKETIYDKAVKARCFDILRGFLPAGITTQLSWHTNLRQAWDKLALLRYWPLPEVQNIAGAIHSLLKEKYANSFGHGLYPDQENYRAQINQHSAYYNPSFMALPFSYTTTITGEKLHEYSALLKNRPERVGLPHCVGECGQITFDFLLDYGSFRDIQRHRNGICRMPLLTTNFGFEPWYLEQLPNDVRINAEAIISKQKEDIAALDATDEVRQYYIAMGFLTACRVTYALPAAVYVAELRSGRLVHPTLRAIAHRMAKSISEISPDIALYADLSQDDWDVRRGEQDIVKK